MNRRAKKRADRTAMVEELTLEAFGLFGTFHNMVNPNSTVFGKPPVQFFPDVLRLDLGGKSVAGISSCVVQDRPLVVDVAEFHSSTGEGILPFNADVLIHVAEPTGDAVVPWASIRIFRVPKWTCVVLNPGVWHHAPFVANKAAVVASVLILLPVRTYANDCKVKNLPAKHQTQITVGQ